MTNKALNGGGVQGTDVPTQADSRPKLSTNQALQNGVGFVRRSVIESENLSNTAKLIYAHLETFQFYGLSANMSIAEFQQVRLTIRSDIACALLPCEVEKEYDAWTVSYDGSVFPSVGLFLQERLQAAA